MSGQSLKFYSLTFKAIIAFSLLSDAASAQLIFDGDMHRVAADPFKDNMLPDIRDRPDGKITPRGLNWGSVFFYPEIGLEHEYNSNLLAEGEQELSDFIATIQSRLKVEKAVKSYKVGFSAEYAKHNHFKKTSEDSEQYLLSFSTEFPINKQHTGYVKMDTGRYIEQRTDKFTASNSLQPVSFDRSSFIVGFQQNYGRLLSRLQADVRKYDYRDGVKRTDLASILPESKRNRVEYDLSGRAEYSFTPSSAVFAGIDVRKSEYNQNAASIRDTTGYEISAGLYNNFSSLIEASVALGYLEQYYALPLRDVKGFSVAAKLKWHPTGLSTIHAGFARELQEGGSRTPRDVFVNRTNIGIEHELLRHIILDASFGMESYDFSALSYHNKRYVAQVGAQYHSSRNILLKASYDFLSQNSAGSAFDRDFEQSRFTISVSFTV